MGISVYAFVLHRVGVPWWRARSFSAVPQVIVASLANASPWSFAKGPLCESSEAAMTFKSWHNVRLVNAYVVD